MDNNKSCFKYNIVILIASFCIYFLLQSPNTSMSVLYLEYVQHFGTTITATGFVPTFYFAGITASGLAGGSLAHRFGAGTTAFAGSILGSMSLLSFCYANNLQFLLIAYGFAGVGVGLIFVSAASIIQQYFTDNRTLATAIATNGMRLGDFTIPPLTRYVCDVEGWRFFAAVFMAGGLLQIAWLAMLYRPKSRKPDEEASEKKPDANRQTDVQCPKLCTILGCQHLREMPFLIFCVSTIMYNICKSVLYVHIVNKAIFMGMDKQTAALMPSVNGLTSVVSRILFGVITTKFTWNRLIWFGCGVFGMGIGFLVMNAADTLPSLVVCIIVASGSLALAEVVQYALLVDLVGIDSVFQAMGMHIFSMGAGFSFGPPFAGFLYDVTESYNVPFYVVGSISCLAGIFSFLTLPLMKRSHGEETIQIEDSEQNNNNLLKTKT